MNRMALDFRVPITRIADIFHERRGITPGTAMRFGRYFKIAPAFRLNLQTRYDLEVMGDREAQQIARDVVPFEAAIAREV
jgi:addiction module HigA family antidote